MDPGACASSVYQAPLLVYRAWERGYPHVTYHVIYTFVENGYDYLAFLQYLCVQYLHVLKVHSVRMLHAMLPCFSTLFGTSIPISFNV